MVFIKGHKKIPGSGMRKGHKMTQAQKKKLSIVRKTFIREKHPRWNGGIRMANGYITVLCPEHPYCGKKGYVREHRFIMEKHLGRILLPSEVVHHINGIITDNRIENLMLFSSSGEHQRYHCYTTRKRDKNGRLAS